MLYLKPTGHSRCFSAALTVTHTLSVKEEEERGKRNWKREESMQRKNKNSTCCVHMKILHFFSIKILR